MKKKCHRRRGSVRSFLSRGTLLLVLVLLLVSFLAARGLGTVRWGMAECLRWQAARLSERFLLEDAVAGRLVQMVGGFAEKIETGNISPLRGFRVLRAFYQGPVLADLMHVSLVNHVRAPASEENADLSAVEKTSGLFFKALKSGKIASADWNKVYGALMEKKICETATEIGFAIPEQVESFRKNSGMSAMMAGIALMERANLSAGFADGAWSADPAAELQKILTAAESGEF